VPFINFPAREINCKLVYYGPGLGGKTANLQWIYEHTGANQKGKMVSLATETDRTLFFDFLPLDLGTVRGFKTRFHLYTVPGQVFYEASRRLILKSADGVVFVADSQEERMDANLVGGDIGGGTIDLRQSLFRPTWRRYATSARDIYMCSASTPPGGGVHGMCGYHAAKMALSRL